MRDGIIADMRATSQFMGWLLEGSCTQALLFLSLHLLLPPLHPPLPRGRCIFFRFLCCQTYACFLSKFPKSLLRVFQYRRTSAGGEANKELA